MEKEQSNEDILRAAIKAQRQTNEKRRAAGKSIPTSRDSYRGKHRG